MKLKFRTGEMARLHGVSKQTLIYYDTIGLFRPKEVGEESGYRYYGLEQCEELDVILCLKSLGMSLKEIKGYLEQRSTTERIQLLESRREVVQRKLREIRDTQKRLESIIGSLKARTQIQPHAKGVRRVEERRVIAQDIAEPHDQYALELAFKKLIGRVKDRFDTNMLELLVFVDSLEPGYKFEKVALMVGSGPGERLPAGDYAYIYHRGPYAELTKTHAALKAYVAAQGREMTGPAIEIMLADAFAVADQSEYLMEVQVPVGPG